MQQVASRGHNRLVPVGKQGHPFTLRFAFKIGIPGEISKQRHQVDVRIQREGFGLAGQQLPDQFIQALGLLLDPAQLFLRCFRLLLGQGQRNPQARQGRAQFVGDVLQQAFLAVDTGLQLRRHGVEIPRQFVGLVAAFVAHAYAGIEIAIGQSARCALQYPDTPRQQA